MEPIHVQTLAQAMAVLKRPSPEAATVSRQVETILQQVRLHGDRAVADFNRRFDGAPGTPLRVSEVVLEQAASALDSELRVAIARAAANIEAFHRRQMEADRHLSHPMETIPGVCCWRRPEPIDSVGFYVPGGSAPLFSSLLMLAIPARLAGCRRRVVCTPPGAEGQIHPAILFTAQFCGIREVYRVGGAQAIAALAWGTETIPRVDKIFGPGNRYVTEAKRQVSMAGVAVDLPAGPSEVLIIADASAPPACVAADLLAQAEHGPDSQVVLITTSTWLPRAVARELNRQLTPLPRRDIAEQALQHSACLITPDLNLAIDIANAYAPEHLMLLCRQAERWAQQVRHAGSVFLGPNTPEVLGDYASGTNHVLPTGGAARAWAGVSVESFRKWISFQKATPEGLATLAPVVERLARAEGLEAHARSVAVRQKQREKR